MGGDATPAGATPAAAVSRSRSWNELMRLLGFEPSGGRRRALQRAVAAHGIDTGHFARHPVQYTDQAISEAVAGASTLREVALRLGARPAPGTLSHLRRRIDAAGIDSSHFPGLHRAAPGLPFTDDELRAAAVGADTVRAAARHLGVPDDGRTRAALGRLLRERDIDTTHFRHARPALPEDRLRAAVRTADSYADVMRALGLDADHANHRRVHRKVAELGLDTGHFRRRSWAAAPRARQTPVRVLRVHPPGSARPNRERLHTALQELGAPYRCASCGNAGEWLGRPITLQIDHISGD